MSSDRSFGVAEAVAATTGWSDVEVGMPVRLTWSWHVPIWHDRQRYLLKIPHWPDLDSFADAMAAGAQPATVAEYESLQALERAVDAADDPQLAAVGAIAFVPTINGILMEHFAGEPLRRRAHPFSSGTDEVCARTGRLLALWHSLSPVERHHCEISEVARHLIVGIADQVSVRARTRIEQAVDRLVDSSGSFDSHTEPWGRIHGDFSLENVLVDRTGRVALIDPNVRRGPLLEDAARLLSDLEFDRRQVLSAGWWRRRGLPHWSEAFMTDAGLADEPLAPVRAALGVLERWVELETSESPSRRLAAGSMRSSFEARINSLVG